MELPTIGTILSFVKTNIFVLSCLFHSKRFSFVGGLVCSHYWLNRKQSVYEGIDIFKLNVYSIVSALTQTLRTLCVWVWGAGHTTAGVGRGLWSGTRGFLQRRSRRRTVLYTLLTHTHTHTHKDSVHIFFTNDSNRSVITVMNKTKTKTIKKNIFVAWKKSKC